MSLPDRLPIAYRDEYPSGTWNPAGGAAAPDFADYTIGGISFRKYEFNGTTIEERLSNNFEIPHDYLYGGTIEVHIHFRPTTNDSGNVKWFFDWEFNKVNTSGIVTPNLPQAQTTLSNVCTITANSQYAMYVYSLGNIPDNGYEIGDMIGFNIRRTPTDTQDTYANEVILEQVALHVPIDGVGSAQKYIK